MKAKSPVQPVSRRMKVNEEQENQAPTEEPSPEVESKKSQRHHHHLRRRDSDKMADSVPTIISLNELQDPEGVPTISSLLKEKKRKTTKRTKDPAVTQVVDSSDTSVSSSKKRLERISTLLTKVGGNGRTEQNLTSSLEDDASLVESKTEGIQSLLQEVKVREHPHSNAGTESTNRKKGSEHEEFDRLNELSRLKARLEVVRNEKTSKTPSRLGHSMIRSVTDTWKADSPSLPPSSLPVQQAMNSGRFMNCLLSKKEAHCIQTEYQESESKSDDLSVNFESTLISHVRMAYEHKEIGCNDALLEDPIFRLVYLAKEMADQAGQIDFFQGHGEYFSRMKPLPSMPPSTLSHPTILHNRESFPRNFDPSMDQLDSHPALNQTSGNLPSFEYLLKKLQAAEEECMELAKSKETLEASLMAANNVREDMKEELEAARATNIFLLAELNVAKEEIAALKDGNKKFEDELEVTQNRLGDAIVHISDLETEGALLRQMVDEKDIEIDEDMVLFKDQHQSVVSVLDHTREIRRQVTNLQGKLSEEDNDPGLTQKLCDDWLKDALAQLDAMDMSLTTCKLELEVKVQPADDEENKKKSSDSTEAGWSLFRIVR